MEHLLHWRGLIALMLSFVPDKTSGGWRGGNYNQKQGWFSPRTHNYILI